MEKAAGWGLREEQMIARLTRELHSELARMVEAGEMTELEANEWANMKAEAWKEGL